MEELFQRLEKRLKDLIDQHGQLTSSNQQLHQNKYKLLAREKALLIKQQKAILQIETLISKLKDIEKKL